MQRDPLSSNLHPDVLLSACLCSNGSDFVALCSDRPLAVFHIEDNPELLPGLYASFQKQTQGLHEDMTYDRLGYTTMMQTEVDAVADEHAEGAEALCALLRDSLTFAFPFHRPEPGYTGMTYTVGRHAANDIVLRHASVSKFHAWFSLDGRRGLRLCAPPTKNGTFVNGKPCVGDEALGFAWGDELRLGVVHAHVVQPGTFLNAVRAVYG